MLALVQEPHHLTLGDLDAEIAEEPRQAFHAGLCPVVLRQHEAAEFGAEMTPRPRRQWRHHMNALGRQPALAAQQNVVRPADQVLNQIILIALEARARRHGDPDDPLLVDPNPALLGPATGFDRVPARLGPRAGLPVHPARLEVRETGKGSVAKSGYLVTCLCDLPRGVEA